MSLGLSHSWACCGGAVSLTRQCCWRHRNYGWRSWWGWGSGGELSWKGEDYHGGNSSQNGVPYRKALKDSRILSSWVIISLTLFNEIFLCLWPNLRYIIHIFPLCPQTQENLSTALLTIQTVHYVLNTGFHSGATDPYETTNSNYHVAFTTVVTKRPPTILGRSPKNYLALKREVHIWNHWFGPKGTKTQVWERCFIGISEGDILKSPSGKSWFSKSSTDGSDVSRLRTTEELLPMDQSDNTWKKPGSMAPSDVGVTHMIQWESAPKHMMES